MVDMIDVILASAIAGEGGGGGGEGAVRYDASQSLSETQKARARGNIGATDAATAAETLGALGLVDFGAEPGVESVEWAGVTITRQGNQLKLNGTATSTIRVRMTGSLRYQTSSVSPEHNPTGIGAKMIAGHAYAVVGKLVSGSAVYDGNSAYPVLYREGTSDTELLTVNANGTSYHARTFVSEGYTDLLWVTLINGTVFTNAVYEYTLEDMTQPSDGFYIGVSSATPTIAAIPGGRYVCTAAAATELAFTPSASGVCSVRFTSGTTPTVLTLPAGVKMPSWWNGCAASTTYEISIADGVYGAVGVWT